MSFSSPRPPLPRRVPPPPPPKFANSNDSKEKGPSFVPPAIPPRGGVRTPITASFQAASNSDNPSSELFRLLARKPPPPQPRRLTAPPALLRTSPISPAPAVKQGTPTAPPLNFSSKPVLDVHEPPASAVGIPSCLRCRDFSEVDDHATLFPRLAVRSVEELAHGLAEPFEHDIDKARVIFTWLHYNISYDAHSFFSGNVQPSTPESTFVSGLAVCEGYAGLFKRLGELIGLQVHMVSGHGKGYGYQPVYGGEPVPEMTTNHAWNCILLDQEWHLVDPCWGAGVLNGAVYEAKLAPKWFISSPVEFGQRHFPADPAFQLTPEQCTWEEYILTPDGPDLPADFHEFGYHPMFIEPAIKAIPDRQFVRFSVCKRCEHMSTAEVDNYVLVISTRDNEFTPLVFNEDEGVWVANIFTPRDGTVTIYAVHTVAEQDARGLGVVGFNKAKGRKPMAFKGLAMWTVIPGIYYT